MVYSFKISPFNNSYILMLNVYQKYIKVASTLWICNSLFWNYIGVLGPDMQTQTLDLEADSGGGGAAPLATPWGLEIAGSDPATY